MIFEFTSKPNFDFMAEFSAQFDIPVFDNCLTIPSSMGKGYIKKIVFGTDFRLIIHRYRLKEDLTIKRNASIERNDLISPIWSKRPIELMSALAPRFERCSMN